MYYIGVARMLTTMGISGNAPVLEVVYLRHTILFPCGGGGGGSFNSVKIILRFDAIHNFVE